jgi:hypothetical protein
MTPELGLTPAGWGVAIGALFAVVWGLAGARALPGAWRRRVSLLSLMAGAGLAARAVVAPPSPTFAQHFDGTIYGVAVVLMLAGIIVAGRLLRGPERRGLLAPTAALIVGLHFIGLWAATGQKLFFGVACGLSAAALIAFGWPRRPNGYDPRLAIAGLGSALVLWAACLSSLV